MADFITRPISPRLLRRYLGRHGWTPSALKNFELFSQGDIELLLSTAGDAAATTRSVADAIRTLAQFEDRTAEAVAGDILSSGYDIIRSRLPEAVAGGDGVPMRRAATFVSGAKELLAASATGELDPKRAYPRTRKEAVAYSDRVIFGHTFRGSFGFVIESPVDLPETQTPMILPEHAPVPFERRVVERLVRGVQTIDTAVKRADVDTAVADHETGFNANMCEKFADLVDNVAPDGLSIEVAFSPELATRPGIAIRSTFFVTRTHAELAAETAQRLRKLAINPNQTVVGRVIRLRSDDDPSELLEPYGSREVTIEWDSQVIGSQVRVRVALTPPDYLAAVEAHKNGRPVQISGELERPARRWRLANPSRLTVL
jgi:hypothetical protein